MTAIAINCSRSGERTNRLSRARINAPTKQRAAADRDWIRAGLLVLFAIHADRPTLADNPIVLDSAEASVRKLADPERARELRELIAARHGRLVISKLRSWADALNAAGFRDAAVDVLRVIDPPDRRGHDRRQQAYELGYITVDEVVEFAPPSPGLPLGFIQDFLKLEDLLKLKSGAPPGLHSR